MDAAAGQLVIIPGGKFQLSAENEIPVLPWPCISAVNAYVSKTTLGVGEPLEGSSVREIWSVGLIAAVFGSAVLHHVEEITPVINKIMLKAAIMGDMWHFYRQLQIVPEAVINQEGALKCFNIVCQLLIGVDRRTVVVTDIGDYVYTPFSDHCQRTVVMGRKAENLFKAKLVNVVKGMDFSRLSKIKGCQQNNSRDNNQY